MPCKVTFDGLPIGYSLSSVKAGEKASIVTTEFISSEDGDEFIRRLEGFEYILRLAGLNARAIAPTINHLLVVVQRDSSGIVYLNEVTLSASIRAKRDIQAGEGVSSDDIVDIVALNLGDITIPNDAGFLFLFSCGWRKGLFFDFAPLNLNEPKLREYEVEKLLGGYYAYLSFQYLFKISDAQWGQLTDQQWFPFISLDEQTIKNILVHINSNWPIDDLLEGVAVEVSGKADTMRNRWRNTSAFQDHLTILETAIERFLQKDYVSATGLLYTRIEGIMRSYHQSAGATTSPSASHLATSAVEGSKNKHLLLPERFETYLKNVYFAGFDPAHPTVLSRHSVSHGVAPMDLFNLKGAVLGLLILEQLSFFMS